MSYKNIDWANPIVIDFETYYDKEYSLKKITTEKYIRCDEFECIGVSIKVADADVKFYKAEHGLHIIKELIRAYPKSPFVSHNNMFDMGILGLRYDIHPPIMVDTVVMAQLCGFDRVAGGGSLYKMGKQLEKMGLVNIQKGTTVQDMCSVHLADMTEKQWADYAEYCKTDTQICYDLYMYMINSMPIDELIMADITTKMWTKPMIDVDVPLLEDYAEHLATSRDDMLSEIAKPLGFSDNDELLSSLRSSKKFKTLLESLGVEVPLKWSEKQEKYIPALSKTDQDFLDLQEHDDPRVRALVETKLGVMSSMEQTRTATFLDVASRGLMPVPLRYAAAHTGRYGGADKLNFQNLSKRTKEPVLRRSLKPKNGYVWVAADSSQIEARLNAYQAGQQDVVDVFLSGKDPYIHMAVSVYGDTYEQIYQGAKGVNATNEGKTKRNVGKALVLGCGYGAGSDKFAELLVQQGLDEVADESPKLVNTYRATNRFIVQFWRICDRVLDTLYTGGTMSFGGENDNLYFADGSSKFHSVTIPSIRLPNGTYIFYQNLRKEADEKDGRINYVYDQYKHGRLVPKRIWGSALCENLTQALAFAILKWQAIEINKAGIPINLNVHDEWASVVPRQQAAQVAMIYYQCMKRVPDYIPQGLLDCEVDVGLNYADLKTLKMEKFV